MADSERDVLAEALHEYQHLDSESECDAVGDSRVLRERLAARGWRLVPSAPEPRTGYMPGMAFGTGGNDLSRAAQPSAEPGLDVERLARAMKQAHGRRAFLTETYAQAIARRYAALTPDRPTPGVTGDHRKPTEGGEPS